MSDNITVYNGPLGNYVAASKDIGGGVQAQRLISGGPFVPPNADYAFYTYTGLNLTSAVYKSGGASGTTLATVTYTYNGNNLLESITVT